MKLWNLTEDKLPPKLFVAISHEIDNKISSIESKNIDKEDSIKQWKGNLLSIMNHISNPSIAWDNIGIYTHKANGETYANIFGHDIAYTIEIDRIGRNYVNVFYFDLNPEEYGLRESRHKKRLLLISESKLQRIIAETIRNVLYN